MTRLGERMLAGALAGLAYEVWRTDNVSPELLLFTVAAIVGLLLAALGRWQESRKDDGMPPAL